MACESLVPLDLYIPSDSGLQVRDEVGEIVLLPHLCACMGGTDWDLTKVGGREGLQNTVCSQGQRDHCEHLI